MMKPLSQKQLETLPLHDQLWLCSVTDLYLDTVGTQKKKRRFRFQNHWSTSNSTGQNEKVGSGTGQDADLKSSMKTPQIEDKTFNKPTSYLPLDLQTNLFPAKSKVGFRKHPKKGSSPNPSNPAPARASSISNTDISPPFNLP